MLRDTRTLRATLILTLMLSAQLFVFTPPAQAGQNTNSSNTTTETTTETRIIRNQPLPRGRGRCRQACNRAYRLCQRGIAPPHIARCRERLRRCLRRCG